MCLVKRMIWRLTRPADTSTLMWASYCIKALRMQPSGEHTVFHDQAARMVLRDNDTGSEFRPAREAESRVPVVHLQQQ